MRDFEFFSENKYIYLPTRKNPKVVLAIDKKFYKNSFELYNPFSLKAKVLKRVAYVFYSFLPYEKKSKSEFIKFLENKLNQNIISSLYFATDKDKVVLQLQSKNAQIIGYLKFPLNEIGKKHIRNEINAYEKLSHILISPLLISKYQNTEFILLPEISGEIGKIDNIFEVLKIFEKNRKYYLYQHSRIQNLKKMSLKYNKELFYLIEKLCKKSNLEYKLVNEHGDFAPWNIIKTKTSYIPFDFEYFVEDGIEYFDAIKFYYQTGKLLKKLNNEFLFNYIKQNLKIKEFEIIFALFLIKEILLQIEENKKCDFEKRMLEFIKGKL